MSTKLGLLKKSRLYLPIPSLHPVPHLDWFHKHCSPYNFLFFNLSHFYKDELEDCLILS